MGGSLYIQAPQELPADQTNINSKRRWADLSPPPLPPTPAAASARPERLTCDHNGPTQHEEPERASTAARPGAGARSQFRGRPGGRKDAQRRPLSLQTQALLPQAAVQDQQAAAALLPETPETCLQAQEAPQRFTSPTRAHGPDASGPWPRRGGRITMPWDPPADSPQTPAPPRSPGLSCDQNSLFQKAAEGSGGGGDTEGITRPSWAQDTWLEIKSPAKEPPHETTAIPPSWMPEP